MDNIIASTLLSGIAVSLTEKPLPVLPEELPATLKPGDVIFLKTVINTNTNTFKSGDLLQLMLQNTEGPQQPFNVRLQAPLRLEGAAGTVKQFAAKVMADGSMQLQPLKLQASSSQPHQAAVAETTVGASSKLPLLTFQPLKLAPVIDNLMTEMNFSQPLRTAVVNALPQTEVIVSLRSLEQQPQLESWILAPLKATLAQMPAVAEQPQQLQTLLQQLQQQINNLSGQTFPARIAPQQVSEQAVVLDSPLGKVWSEQPLKLPPDTTLQLEVRQTLAPMPSADIPLLKSVVETLAKLLPIHEFTRIEPQALLRSLQQKDDGLAQLLKIFEPVVETSPQLSTQLLQKIPGIKPDFLQTMHSFYRAAEGKDISKWLGSELVSRISTETPRGAEVLSRAENIVSAAVRETPLWRLIEIPFFDGSQLLPLQIALKKDQDEEKQKSRPKGGLRFMVNTEFSRLGAFQFDGFSQAAERRFDLVIRTSQVQEKDFCSQIINLFKKSLQDVSYIGTIKINQREAFIRAEEAASALKSGVYI